MKTLSSASSLVLLFAIIAGSCTGSTEPDSISEPDGTVAEADATQTDVVPEDTHSPSLSLPTNTAVAECDPASAPATALSWAEQSNVVVVGTVVELRPADGPWTTVLGGQVIAECEQPDLQGIDVVLEDVRAQGEPTSQTLVVRITAEELLQWSVRPTVSATTVDWRDDASMEGLEYGMQLGGFLEQGLLPGVYLPVGRLFWLDERGVLSFQSSEHDEDCPDAYPRDIAEATFESLLTAVDGATWLDAQGPSERAEYSWQRSSFCGDAPPEGIACLEIEPGQIECPVDYTCNLDTMVCEPARR